MERRSEQRFDASGPVALTILGRPSGLVTANLDNFSGRGMRLLTSGPIPLYTAVKIHIGDDLLLGEVCYCWPLAEGFAVGLQLEHSLTNVTDLVRLVESIRAYHPQTTAARASSEGAIPHVEVSFGQP